MRLLIAMGSFVIRLNSLRFFSRIGVEKQERMVGNEFLVDIAVTVPATDFEPENLDTTISYADIYDIVDKEMNVERLLLESTAMEIASAIKKMKQSIGRVEVRITKSAPPISGIQGSATVEYVTE